MKFDEKIFVIGGAEIFLSVVDAEKPADTFFQQFEDFNLIDTKNFSEFKILHYMKGA